ncbi:uncharacterized protein VNE69_08030 [Vairimorpha necatrix]|uniref:Uncharacterized protein n=1 Tax=Vairimorpha necatrix TaxID=6039 RepID=A0AAX4JE44_9MICR
MRDFIILFMILFVSSWERITNNISNIFMYKIYTKNFLTINTKNRHRIIRFKFFDLSKTIKINIDYPDSSNRSIKKNFHYNGQKINDIVKKLNEYNTEICQNSKYKNILIYNQINIELNKIGHDIIKHLKNQNSKQPYDFIIESRCYIETIFNRKEDKKKGYNVPLKILTFVRKKDSQIIFIHIKNKHFVHIFEIDIQDIDLKKWNLQIAKSIMELKVINTILKSRSNFQLEYEKNANEDKNVKLEKKRKDYFNIIIDDEKLTFEHNESTYCYSNNFLTYDISNETSDKESCISKLKTIFDRFLNKNQKDKFLILFYSVIEQNKKVNFLVQRILNKSDSAFCLIFQHICAKWNIISINDINSFCAIRKLKKFNGETEQYMKMILKLEAENYINEDVEINEPIFRSFKELAKLPGSYQEKNIDLYKVLYDLDIHYFFLVRTVKEVWEKIFYTIKLFSTELECYNFASIIYKFENKKMSDIYRYCLSDYNKKKVKNILDFLTPIN